MLPLFRVPPRVWGGFLGLTRIPATRNPNPYPNPNDTSTLTTTTTANSAILMMEMESGGSTYLISPISTLLRSSPVIYKNLESTPFFYLELTPASKIRQNNRGSDWATARNQYWIQLPVEDRRIARA
jgi:hypothetical protein